MRVLLDNCVDTRLCTYIENHEVVHVIDRGWDALSNGKLLSAAAADGFDVLVTVDKNLRHQQNFAKRRIGLVVLSPLFTTLEYLVPLVPQLQRALDNPEPDVPIVVIRS